LVEEEFPIKTATACQLKWSHSTVFLPTNQTSSCHRVDQHDIQDNFDFHNNPEKIIARKQMLQGEWPGKGCEHCKVIEDAGGTSDRMLHLKFPGLGPPPELKDNLTATHVTPRWVEVYFSNLCQLACNYCDEYFSSTWQTENRKFGYINDPNRKPKPLQYMQASENNLKKFWIWADTNIEHLYNLHVLGGEPFTQPQTDELFEYLSTKECPELTVTITSNLSIPHDKMIARIKKLQELKFNHNIKHWHVIGSLDNWGEHAEYTRYGLKLDLFVKNFEYLLHNTSATLGINSAWTSLTTSTYPDLVRQINKWNTVRRVYHSLMQVGGKPFLHPKVFGPWILEQGMYQAHELFETYDDPELEGYKEYFAGIIKSIEQTEPDEVMQHALHGYLSELDRRRNTNYTALWPEIYEKIHD